MLPGIGTFLFLFSLSRFWHLNLIGFQIRLYVFGEICGAKNVIQTWCQLGIISHDQPNAELSSLFHLKKWKRNPPSSARCDTNNRNNTLNWYFILPYFTFYFKDEPDDTTGRICSHTILLRYWQCRKTCFKVPIRRRVISLLPSLVGRSPSYTFDISFPFSRGDGIHILPGRTASALS